MKGKKLVMMAMMIKQKSFDSVTQSLVFPAVRVFPFPSPIPLISFPSISFDESTCVCVCVWERVIFRVRHFPSYRISFGFSFSVTPAKSSIQNFCPFLFRYRSRFSHERERERGKTFLPFFFVLMHFSVCETPGGRFCIRKTRGKILKWMIFPVR